MWAFLIRFLPFLGGLSGTIEKITSKIVDLKVAQVQATTDQEKIHTEEQIKVLEAQRDIFLRQNDREAHITSMTRVGLTLPIAFIVWKLLLWDKGIGSLMGCSGNTEGRLECLRYTTDKLDPNLWWVIYVVLTFWFVQSLSTIWKRV